jgi:hypothetical protein
LDWEHSPPNGPQVELSAGRKERKVLLTAR